MLYSKIPKAQQKLFKEAGFLKRIREIRRSPWLAYAGEGYFSDDYKTEKKLREKDEEKKNLKMARLHSRRKGKSGSKRPLKQVASWAPYKGKEVEKLVVKFAKAGKAPSEIGLLLRDTYGIQSIKALTGKKTTGILREHQALKALPEDLINLIKKLIAVKKHMDKNRQDKTALRGIQLTEAKIQRLIKHYKRVGKLAEDWKLDRDRLKMYVE